MADVDYDETSHCELAVGPPKFRTAIPKNTRLTLGLHNLDEDEKVILEAKLTVKKVVKDGDGS
ncbi:hypothetical protein PM025_14765 [Halorubrum ezzemoulense]|uniref:hypothetical protein n=1 Tax=Halorubrum ezzemoulense TaxID=337243 RepID=UPI00232C74A0|nr:hypothetical protein [Halorubrum ezzemoulense]MDB2265379.1 hypothetical protein [Halorubrum ezzemoulense]